MKKITTRVTTRPRISVFRSNRYIYVQIIDDQKGHTVCSASDKEDKSKNKLERATNVGTELAREAVKKGIKKVWFDRGSYKYHGRVKALAEAARKGGLEF